MSATMIQVDQTELQKILSDAAEFVDAAAPKMEKLAALETGLVAFAKQASERLAQAGFISKSDVDQLQKEILNGGFDKIAEVVDFTIRNTNVMKMGHSAEEPTVKSETSDDVWEKYFGRN